MKTHVKLAALSCAILLCLAPRPLQGQPNQVQCGAESTNLNSKLTFANAAAYDITSGYTQPLIYTLVSNLVQLRGAVSEIKGFYNTTNLAFHALSRTSASPAADGSYLVCEVVSVSGPEGGTFSFWEQGARGPTYSFPAGAAPASGKNRFDVTDIAQGGGLPYGDPFGAIPGRRLTVDKPGEYVVGFKLHDTSSNSLSIGPMHASSDLLTIKFQTAVQPSLARIAVTNEVATLTLNQGGLTNIFLETSTSLVPANWATVAGPFTNAPIGGNTRLLKVTNTESILSRFYRLRGTGP